MTPHVTSAFHPSGFYSPQDVQIDDQFHDDDENTTGAHHKMLVQKKSLTELIIAPLKVGHKEILIKKELTIDFTKNMTVLIYTEHPPIIIKVTLTSLQEEVVMMEVLMALSVVIHTTLTPYWWTQWLLWYPWWW